MREGVKGNRGAGRGRHEGGEAGRGRAYCVREGVSE